MIKKIIIPVLFLALFPVCAFAQSQKDIKEGSVVQLKGSSQKFLIRNGQRWRISTPYTFRELGLSKKNIITIADKDAWNRIMDGEPITITSPKLKGAIDMHEHFRVDGDMDMYLDVTAKLGIQKTLFVPTGVGPDNGGYKDHMAKLLELQKQYPDRIIAFCTVDEADPSAPEVFKKCLDEGGKGLKLMAGHPDFYDVPLNNDVMKKLFAIARERDVAVLIHVSIMSLPTAEAEFKDLLDQFPDVRVQFAHYCSSVYGAINLEKCEAFLDKYPNVYTDLSMGGGILRYFKFMTRDMQKFKDFVEKYQDRIVAGSDMILAPSPSPTARRNWVKARIMCDLSLQQDKWYKCPLMNDKGEYTLLPGYNLSREVLKKIWIDNPKKFLKM